LYYRLNRPAFFSSIAPPPPTSTLFPYTTLFRSVTFIVPSSAAMLAPTRPASARPVRTGPSSSIMVLPTSVPTKYNGTAPVKVYRSEEHTSELQSRSDLVCRLLLEKKNNLFKARQ